MVAISGRLNGSITGVVRATPDSPFIDNSTNPPTLVVNPYEAPITNSQFTITLPQSQILQGGEGITYKWEILSTQAVVTYYLLDGTIYGGPVHQWANDNKWYTGSTHSTDSRLLDRVSQSQNIPIQEPFHAVAPDSPTPVPFTSLIGIPSQSPWFDIGLARIADLLTTNATYRDRISSKFVIRGAYAANTIYTLNDMVSFNGNSYVWRNSTPAENQPPPLNGDNANWLMTSQRGAAGGTGAQIVGYNPTTWANNAEAAARGDVRDAIASIPNPDLSNYLTVGAGLPRNNAVMTGSSKRAPMTYPVAAADRATELVTAGYVEDGINALGVGRLPRPLVYARRANIVNLGQDVRSVIAWDNRLINTGNILDTSGIITIADAGWYLFYLALQLTIQGIYNSSQGLQQIIARGILRNTITSADFGDFFDYNYGASQATFTNVLSGMRLENLGANTTLRIDATTQKSGSASSIIGTSQIDGVAVQNYVIVWRVA